MRCKGMYLLMNLCSTGGFAVIRSAIGKCDIFTAGESVDQSTTEVAKLDRVDSSGLVGSSRLCHLLKSSSSTVREPHEPTYVLQSGRIENGRWRMRSDPLECNESDPIRRACALVWTFCLSWTRSQIASTTERRVKSGSSTMAPERVNAAMKPQRA